MDAIVVYESIYGNTRAIAEAVAEGLGDAPVYPVHEMGDLRETVRLLVVGGPTHVHGVSTPKSRYVGAHTAEHDDDSHVEPGATEEPGLRAWIAGLTPEVVRNAAAFDTRLERSRLFTGSAARGITRRLHGRGIDVVATHSFPVKDTEGPLEAGELERARAWGAKLAQSRPGSSKTPVESRA